MFRVNTAHGQPLTDISESHKSPRRKPGDSGHDHHPTCHADPVTPNDPVSPDFRPGLFLKRSPAAGQDADVSPIRRPPGWRPQRQRAEPAKRSPTSRRAGCPASTSNRRLPSDLLRTGIRLLGRQDADVSPIRRPPGWRPQRQRAEPAKRSPTSRRAGCPASTSNRRLPSDLLRTGIRLLGRQDADVSPIRRPPGWRPQRQRAEPAKKKWPGWPCFSCS